MITLTKPTAKKIQRLINNPSSGGYLGGNFSGRYPYPIITLIKTRPEEDQTHIGEPEYSGWLSGWVAWWNEGAEDYDVYDGIVYIRVPSYYPNCRLRPDHLYHGFLVGEEGGFPLYYCLQSGVGDYIDDGNYFQVKQNGDSIPKTVGHLAGYEPYFRVNSENGVSTTALGLTFTGGILTDVDGGGGGIPIDGGYF